MAWEFDRRISMGNVFTALSILGLGLMAYRDLTEQTALLAAQQEINTKAISSNEGRIRSVEYTTARQDERLILILDSLRKIEAKIDRGP